MHVLQLVIVGHYSEQRQHEIASAAAAEKSGKKASIIRSSHMALTTVLNGLTARLAHPGEGSYMILMPMCDDHSLNLVFPLCQESGVRQDFVHAQV